MGLLMALAILVGSNRLAAVDILNIPPPAATVGAPYAANINGTSGTPRYTFAIASGTLPPGLQLIPGNAVEATIVGVPTQAGSFTFELRITDSTGATATRTFTINVNSTSQVVITSTYLSPGNLNAAYTAQLTAEGGQFPFTYSITSGSLPPGLSLSSAGEISGTPTSRGTFAFTVLVRDGRGATAQAALRIVIDGDELAFSFPYLRAGRPGVFYLDAVSGTGGMRPYRYSIVSGQLPDGLQLTRNGEKSGFIQGIPLREGLYRFRLRVEDASNRSMVEQDYTIPVNFKDLGFATTELPPAYLGQPYRFQVIGEGSNGPYRFSSSVDAMGSPLSAAIPGLTMSTTGEISGTPTQAGSWPVDLIISDLFFNGFRKTFQFRVLSSSLRIETSSLPAGVTGQSYTTTLRAAGQTGAVRFALVSGTLPEGLTLSTSGEIRGIPQRALTASFVVSVTDAQGQTAQTPFTLTITNPPLSLSSNTLPVAFVGQSYTGTLTAVGGAPPYTFVATTALPPGLTLSAAGRLSGMPTQAGSSAVGLRISDSTGAIATATVNVVIQAPVIPFTISGFAPPAGQVNFNYQFAFAATGGREPLRWRVQSGSLPVGTRLDSSGLLRGWIASAGSYRFVVEARDTSDAVATLPVALDVAPATELPDSSTDEDYAARITGLDANVTRSDNALGLLPEGLSVSPRGMITGRPLHPGLYTFGLRGLNERGAFTTVALNLVVTSRNPLAIETPALPGATVQTPYRQRLLAPAASEPARWQLLSGRWPTGLSLDGDTLTGTPLEEGLFSAVVQVTDASGRSATRYFELNVVSAPAPVLNAITSAASYEARGIAPGEVLALFGLRLGSRVWFDGLPAPVLYRTDGQVGAVAPFRLESKRITRVVVENDGVFSGPFRVPVLTAKPALFSANGSGQGPGAILNENGSVNTSENRAQPGQVVVLFLTGGGAMTPPGVDGRIATALSQLNAPVSVQVGGRPAELLYAGNAPGLIEGVLQANVRLPAATPPGLAEILIRIGPESSLVPVTVWVRE
jgi:uncharacterized protein (TIGR03437 family)